MARDEATHVSAVLRIDGTEVPCDPTAGPVPLSGLKVTWGRSNLVEKPAASTVDFELADEGRTYAGLVKYGSTVEVLGVLPDGSRFQVFYGHVSDLSVSRDEVADAMVQATAIDPTARFSSVTIGDEPWPQESVAARRTRIRNLVGGDSAFLWPAIPTGLHKVTAYPVIAKDVDSQPAWDLVTDFLWGLGTVAWPVPGPAGQPAIKQTPNGPSPTGSTDTRSSRGIPVADFTTGSGAKIPTVCLDACDLDLEGVEFTARPEDIQQDVRVTWGRDEDEEDTNVTAGVYVLKADPPRPSWDAGRILEITSDVAGDALTGRTRAQYVAQNWSYQLGSGVQAIVDPWRVGAVRLDPDTVTAMLAFHEAMQRLLDVQTRISHAVLLQELPDWSPWRATGSVSPAGWKKGDTVTNILATVQGGTYEFTDGRWLLELNLSVQNALYSPLAPPTSVVVRPRDIVDLPHDTPGIVADPQTHWALGEYAVFTDGRWGWDGTQWVRNGVQPIMVAPGGTTDLPHDDYRIKPSPATPWTFGQYATFSDGTYAWTGDDWLAVQVARPGGVVLKAHDVATVVPDPTTAWASDAYATFTDGQWRWSGTAWVTLERIVVRPGSTVTVPHDDPTVDPQPTTAWATGQYATFSDGTYTWNGSAWVAYSPLYVSPGDAVQVPHDDPSVLPDPTTAWDVETYATFSDGMYTWNGSAWVPATTVTLVNLNTNPSLETGTTKYVSSASSWTSIARDTTWAAEGAASLKVSPLARQNNTSAYLALTDMEAGKTYTVTATLHLEAAQTGVLHTNARCLVVAGAGASAPAPNAPGDHVVSLTFVAPSAAFNVTLYNGSSTDAPSDVWWDLITVVEGTSQVQFSGDTPPDPDGSPTYGWTGTPHASTSVLRSLRQVQWLNAPGGVAWDDVPAGMSWTEWTGGGI